MGGMATANSQKKQWKLISGVSEATWQIAVLTLAAACRYLGVPQQAHNVGDIIFFVVSGCLAALVNMQLTC